MKHCLVVDHSRAVRTVARSVLATLAFQIEEAEDGATALRKCRHVIPDLVLLDANLRDMSGIDFLCSLRRDVRGRRPVVVYCTMQNDPGHIAEALRAGASQYLLKPFDQETLKTKLIETGMLP